MEQSTLPAPATEKPLTKINRELCQRYLADNKVYSRYPKVSEQLETIPLDRSKLMPFGYNPSIIQYGDDILMAYRFHGGSHSTQIASATVRMDGVVLSNRHVSLPGSCEDPKLLGLEGRTPTMSWVDSTFPTMPYHAVVRHGVFDNDGRLNGGSAIDVPGNYGTTIQKNYVPFWYGDSLHCIYQCHPTQKVYNLNVNPPALIESPSLRWPYGEIRGGTSPLPYNGKLLRFFHSSLDNEWTGIQHARRYFAGALLMDPEPPFAMTQVSRKPILYGSEIDELKVKDRPFHWKANVVFPGGAVQCDGHWLLSVGVNDSQCTIVKVTEKDLNL